MHIKIYNIIVIPYIQLVIFDGYLKMTVVANELNCIDAFINSNFLA